MMNPEKAQNYGLIPIPRPVPLSMEQQVDPVNLLKRVERLEQTMRNFIASQNEGDAEQSSLSHQNLSELQSLRAELVDLRYKINELTNRMPPSSYESRFEAQPSARRRELFNK